MDESTRIPDLKEVLGAMIFAANRALTIREMRNCLQEVARETGAHTAVFAAAKDADVRSALQELATDFERRRCGFLLAEVGGGFRLQSEESCGVWLRQLLNLRKSSRLSQPSLETLAIIACRQPITRAEIEGIRGVSVDHVIRMLMEMQLVRIVGRSELPGRPFLFGTTQGFLEHFGLKDLAGLAALTGVQLQARRPTVKESVAVDVPVTEADQAIVSPAAAGEAPSEVDGDDAEVEAVAEDESSGPRDDEVEDPDDAAVDEALDEDAEEELVEDEDEDEEELVDDEDEDAEEELVEDEDEDEEELVDDDDDDEDEDEDDEEDEDDDR